MPFKCFRSVDLPDPLGPASITNSPEQMLRVTSSRPTPWSENRWDKCSMEIISFFNNGLVFDVKGSSFIRLNHLPILWEIGFKGPRVQGFKCLFSRGLIFAFTFSWQSRSPHLRVGASIEGISAKYASVSFRSIIATTSRLIKSVDDFMASSAAGIWQ